jgi:hypothetical protein
MGITPSLYGDATPCLPGFKIVEHSLKINRHAGSNPALRTVWPEYLQNRHGKNKHLLQRHSLLVSAYFVDNADLDDLQELPRRVTLEVFSNHLFTGVTNSFSVIHN